MKAKREKKKSKVTKTFEFLFLITILAGIFYYLYYTYQNISIEPSNYETKKVQSTVNEQTVENVEENSKTVGDTIENMMSSIVGISKLKDTGGSIFSNSNETSLGLGTGIIVSENGYILSNEHVTGQKFSTCYITLENNKKYTGIVVWSDSDLDLSITKIEAEGLKKVNLGDSDNIKIGETVYAIGNPIGYEFRRTVTAGIISSKNRSIKLDENEKTYMSNLIQTDATINPGNSGGPLIYPNGNVIGINTVKINSADGIGFAIPINVAKPVIEGFINENKFEQATIGIYAYDKDVIPYLSDDKNFTKGIYVAQIIDGGPADNKTLQEGDIINSIDGIELNTMNDLREYIFKKKPGDIVNLQISRRKIVKNVNITLGSK